MAATIHSLDTFRQALRAEAAEQNSKAVQAHLRERATGKILAPSSSAEENSITLIDEMLLSMASMDMLEGLSVEDIEEARAMMLEDAAFFADLPS